MDQMQIAAVGHVDHGKSTVIGRLMADTNALPKGKLEAIKERCRRESKAFEYAFLLDALKDEQNQGITIDSARCFFKTDKRDYLIIDAPGHIEFLKNMVSGAARAEGALLVIDANEGVKENSRRHGYILSLLGIDQLVVLINKMDLVGYDEKKFNKIKEEYSEFLDSIGIRPKEILPVSALKGDNIAQKSDNLSWWQGSTVLQALDHFKKAKPLTMKPFRMYVQDVYKFTQKGDSRRIIAGKIESGEIREGDEVMFIPSGKRSKIETIEVLQEEDRSRIQPGYHLGVTLSEQIYVNRGQVMCKENGKAPFVSSLIKANLFWMGKKPMKRNKEYLFKIGTAKAKTRIKKIASILDSSTLKRVKKDRIERHDAAEVLLELSGPIAYDLASSIPAMGRFVIVDGYDVAGGGIITNFVEDKHSELREQVFLREKRWDHSRILFEKRALRYGQSPKLVLLTGVSGVDKKTTAKELEQQLFEQGRKVYFLGIGNLLRGLDSDIDKKKRKEHIRRLGEVAHILMDAGLIVIATVSDLDDDELKLLQTITFRDEMIIIKIGRNDISADMVDLELKDDGVEENIYRIMEFLKFENVIFQL